MINSQEYLDEKYPIDGICKRETPDKGSDNQEGWNNQGKKREEIKKLDISNQELEGELIIQNFPKLEKIKCGSNKNLSKIKLINLPQLNFFNANNCQIAEIKIKTCPNINFLNVANNLLTDLNFLTNLNSEKLTTLSLHSNNFSEQDLSFFSKFTGLQQLFLDNCDKAKFRKGIYNRFAGSLKPLQSLSKLEILSIGKTDIDSGLEYLPKSFRKIGFNLAIKVVTGCSKLSQELEEVAKIEGVTEKLQQHEEGDPIWISGYYRLASWRQALNLLGEERFKKQNAQKWLDENYSKTETEELKKRENITFLNVNDKNLKGHLDLRDFINLEKLDCSDNKLTSLDLRKCSKLTHLYCDNNLFTNLSFLKTLPCPKRLRELYLEDNEKLLRQNLDFLIPFTELVELNIENCPFQGSLKSLKNLKELERIYISNTDIDDGLDDLPENCQRVYCDNSRGNKKSLKIVKQLSKYAEEKFDESGKIKRYYEINKWRANKQNDMIASVIPLERLYVIRNNLKQFLKKWGTEKDKNNQNELSKLKSPEELSQERKWKIYLPQFIGRGVAVAGAVLTFQDYSAAGGGMLGVYPFAELGISKLEKDFEDKKNKWREFLADADTFLDNYHELLGILVPFESKDLKAEGSVNEALKKLKTKIEEFLKEYDKDENKEIDIEELKIKREKFAWELSKENNKIKEIIDAIEELERAITEHRRTSYGMKERNIKELPLAESQETVSKTDSLTELKKENLQSKLEKRKLEILEKIKNLELDLENYGKKDKKDEIFVKSSTQQLQTEIDDLKVELVIIEVRIKLDKENKKGLETQLKEEEINFQQIKKELIGKQSDLSLLENQEQSATGDKKLSESIKILAKKIDELKKDLTESEKKITGINFLLLEDQLKNFWDMNWNNRISHGWKAISDGTKYCATGTWNCLTAPAWYWKQWRNRKELLVSDIKKDKDEENVISAKESESNLNNIQKSETEQVIDLDEHFAQKKEIQTGLKRRKSINQTQDRKLSNKKIELVELQIQEEQQIETGISEYNSEIQIPPKK